MSIWRQILLERHASIKRRLGGSFCKVYEDDVLQFSRHTCVMAIVVTCVGGISDTSRRPIFRVSS